MKKIGIVGGGQLGKMMILDAKRLDYYFVILDPTPNCPAHSIADEHIVAGFDDADAIHRLAEQVDVVTYEFEHIQVRALQQLEEKGVAVYPTSQTLLRIQNKLEQKAFLRQSSIPVPDFVPVNHIDDIHQIASDFGFPMILKTCTGGYDGKGNAVIKTAEDIQTAFEALGAGTNPLMAERWVAFDKEISVLVCRSTGGEIKVFPVAENVHVDSILDETMVPADITEKMTNEAMAIARKAAQAVDSYGMLCVELFAAQDGQVLVNELAPRPHNSGHYTIEGCYTSQFEQHIRAILGLPLGDTGLIRPTVMKNIIGDSVGPAKLAGLEKAYRYGNVKVHIYGKEMTGIGRKMGHITVTDETVEAALIKAREAHQHILFEK